MGKGKSQPELEVVRVPLAELHGYEGNAKQHTNAQLDAVRKSISEFGFVNPVLAWHDADGRAVIVAGHARCQAARKEGLDEVPVVFVDHLGDEQRRALTLADNQTTMMTGWDMEQLTSELDALADWFDMGDFGFGLDDDGGWDGAALSTEGREGDEGYDEFTEKFEPKLTTDDCYTPDGVFQAVKDWACAEYGIDPDSCVRPFYPGGDYERYDYPEGCTVLDNPPFSIMSKIIDFYEARGIPYFLFGPGLSLFSGNRPCNYLVPGAIVTYENGAKVNTGFVTSYGDWKIDTAPELAQAVADACKKDQSAQNTYEYPAEVVTSALIMKIARRGIRFRVKEAECSFVRSLDGQKAIGQGLFGGGFLISPEAAAEKAAAERMEAVDAYTVELSGRERAIVESLSRRAE